MNVNGERVDTHLFPAPPQATRGLAILSKVCDKHTNKFSTCSHGTTMKSKRSTYT